MSVKDYESGMGSYLKKILLSVLGLGYMSFAHAQMDSNMVDSQTVVIQKTKFYEKLIVPATLLGYGALSLGNGSIRQFDRYVNASAIGEHGYSGSADDYLRYGPIAVVYGMDLLGMKAKNNFVDRTAILLMSMAITSTAVSFTKNNIHRERPDGSSFSSFPSSHTAMAFMAAEFMHQEYKDRSVWFSVIGYGTATFTGVLRMYHHVHWFSDVVMGAGYGILATKLSYWMYPYLKNVFLPKKNNHLVVAPTLQQSHLGFTVRYRLN